MQNSELMNIEDKSKSVEFNKIYNDLLKYREKVFNIFSEKQLVKDKILDEIIANNITEFATIISETISSDINNEYLMKLKSDRRTKKKRILYADKGYPNSKLNKAIEAFKLTSELVKDFSAIDLLEEELNKWAESQEDFMCDYKFTDSKTLRFKKTGLKEDSFVILVEEYLKAHKKGMSVESMISSFTQTPIDIYSHYKNVVTIDDKFVYEVGENRYITEIAPSVVQSGQLNKELNDLSFNILNKNDLDILRYLMKKGADSNPSFFINGQITLPVKQICEEVFNYKTKYYIDLVERSITKMTALQIYAYTKNGTQIIKQPLYKGDIKSSLDFEEYSGIDGNVADIIVSSDYLEDMITGNVISIYSDVLDILTNKDAKVVIFHLQKERIVHYYNNKTNNDFLDNNIFFKKVDYRYFYNILIMTNKRKSYNIARIEKFLEEIKNTGQILEDWKRQGDYFYLAFTPISLSEKEDLDNRTESSIRTLISNETNDSNEYTYIAENSTYTIE